MTAMVCDALYIVVHTHWLRCTALASPLSLALLGPHYLFAAT